MAFFCIRYRMLCLKWNLIVIKYKQIEMVFLLLAVGKLSIHCHILFNIFRILCYLVLNISLRPDMYRIVIFE